MRGLDHGQTQAGSDTHQRRAERHHNTGTLSSAADTGIPATQSHVSHVSKSIRAAKAWAGARWHIWEAAKTPCSKTLQSVGRKPEEHPGNVRRSTGKACKPWWSPLLCRNPVAVQLKSPSDLIISAMNFNRLWQSYTGLNTVFFGFKSSLPCVPERSLPRIGIINQPLRIFVAIDGHKTVTTDL